jgi:hypothetical protein
MKSRLILVAFLFCFSAKARIVTLTVGGTNTSALLTVHTNEAFSIVSGYGSPVSIEKGGQTFTFQTANFSETSSSHPNLNRLTVAGPAVVRLVGSFPSFVTVELLPDPFPPDKTIVLAQGTKASIVMEASTNLVQWVPVTPGSFTNNPVSLFFRLRADPIE